VLFWRVDEQYKSPIFYGTSGPIVSWLAQQFATYDQQERVLADNQFNASLQQRVKIFQRANQLEDDGVVGIKTLLKLEEKLHHPVTLLEAWPDEPVPEQTNFEAAPTTNIASQELANTSEADK